MTTHADAVPLTAPPDGFDFDLIVQGATSAGVVAAVAAGRSGVRVAIVDPTTHVGGLVTAGLCRSDVERQEPLIGGLALEFFREAGDRSGEHPWRFEPHAAEAVFRDWLAAADVTLLQDWVPAATTMGGSRITGLVSTRGDRVTAPLFVDATYEGDLFAAAGASWGMGREDRDLHGEDLAGRREILPNPHQFGVPVSATDEQGDLLPWIQPYDSLGVIGHGDGKLQSYCHRVVVTDDRERFVPIEQPEDYRRKDYELLARYVAALGDRATRRSFMGPGRIPGGKFDLNSGGPVSTSLLGASWEYPEASHARRRELDELHRRWAHGLLWFLGNDEDVPASVRAEMSTMGLPADEFADNGHWPTALYVRDARRLQGEYVLTEHDLLGTDRPTIDDAIGMGGYNIDIREVQWAEVPIYRFPDVFPEAMTEGYVSVPVAPYPIPYRVLLPRRDECTNLLVSTCVSSSHVAFASFRMESQFMIAGQAAGTAVAIARATGVGPHDVPVDRLQQELRRDGAVLAPRS